MYALVENGVVVQEFESIPETWKNISGFNNYDGEKLLTFGFFPIVVEEYNSTTLKLVSTFYELHPKSVIRKAVTEPRGEVVRKKIIPDVTPRQMRLKLLSMGITSAMIEAAINTLPNKDAAMIAWEYSTAFQRTNPFVLMIGHMLNFSDEQLDQVWLEAKEL